jgi:hypothetical protein
MRNLRRILSIAMALLLLFSLGLAASAEKSGELEILGEELFTESNALTPVICADGGIPYVAFIDFANEGKLTVMKYEEEEWRVVGNAGFSEAYGVFDISVDDGIPYVAFQTKKMIPKVSVMKFDGADWIYVGSAGFSSGEAYYTSLDFDDGIPYVAFADSNNQAVVMKYEQGAWSALASPGIEVGFSNYNEYSLRFEVNGSNLYLAVSDAAYPVQVGESVRYKATVTLYDGSSVNVLGSTGLRVNAHTWMIWGLMLMTVFLIFIWQRKMHSLII